MPQSITKRAELHTHLGSAVDPSILWDIAHEQGIKLPSKDYWDFEDMITMKPGRVNKNLNEMHFQFFYWTELIQSSPEAIETSVKSVIGGGYRKCNLILQELRFNPMKRNRGGERDLDYIIKSSLWGLDRALLEYPQVKAGIILMMDRMLSYKQNEIIINKAIKYKNFGIVGVDVAGPARNSFSMEKHIKLFNQARDAGLGLTVHTGEEGSLKEVWLIVKELKPERIGHGVMCVKDAKLMQAIQEQGIVLEICPTSNLKNSVIKNTRELKQVFNKFLKAGIKFTINTDGPEMYRTNIMEEENFLRSNGILTEKQIRQCQSWAFESTFIK